LIVSRLELSHTLKNPHGKERRLAKALTKVAKDYDLILIDCAPTESILTEAAYHASRYVLVPVKPEFLATIGLPLLARSIQEFKYENGDHAIDICGIVFNHSSSYSIGPEGARSIKEVQAEGRKKNWHVFQTQVRYSRSYAKAAREGKPIGATSNVHGYVAREFVQFADEFLEAVGLTQEEHMITSSQFLDYEVALLLAKYGKSALLAAFAKQLQLTADELEAFLKTPLSDKPAPRSTKRSSPVDLVEQLAQECPNKAQFLRTLHGRFGDRTFLPELRDVKRFFEQHDRPFGTSRSRAETLHKVLRLLAELDVAELERLCQIQPESTYSSLAVISDEILRRAR
jgi:MinD-like ATPase involved in chromosome partitioning or flagellar assembly